MRQTALAAAVAGGICLAPSVDAATIAIARDPETNGSARSSPAGTIMRRRRGTRPSLA